MPRHIEEPKVVREHDQDWMTHPAFGQVMVHRVSGKRALYGSDFMHRGYVVVTVKKSALNRRHSIDWAYSKEPIVSFAMTEAQWAAFVSSFGVGEGTQCTLERLGNAGVPEFPLRDEAQLYKGEADERINSVVKSLQSVRASLEADLASIPAKKRAPLLSKIDDAIREISQNLPYVSDVFGEHLEKRVSKAKTEVAAWMNNAVRRAGLSALMQREQPPLQIECDKEQT